MRSPSRDRLRKEVCHVHRRFRQCAHQGAGRKDPPPRHSLARTPAHCGERAARHRACARRPAAARVVLLRDLRGRDRRPDGRAASGRRRRPHRGHGGGPPRALRPLLSRGTREARLQVRERRAQLGALRILQRHRVAHLRRVHVRAGLREDGPGPAHRPPARQGHGQADPHAGLRGHDRRHDPRALHAVQHGQERRDDLPGDPQPPGALRLEAERPIGPPHRSPSPRPA